MIAIISYSNNSSSVASHAKAVFQKHFDFDVSSRIRIIRESDKFRVKEDESLLKAKREHKEGYEVYFDNVFVCFFNEVESPPIVEMRFLKELIKLKKEKKVFWNPHMYAVIEAENEAREKKDKKDRKQSFETKMKQATSSEEKIVHSAIQKAINDGK